MCRICHGDEDTRHIDLYVSGSEGLHVCHGCEMQIVAYVRSLQYVATKSILNTKRK